MDVPSEKDLEDVQEVVEETKEIGAPNAEITNDEIRVSEPAAKEVSENSLEHRTEDEKRESPEDIPSERKSHIGEIQDKEDYDRVIENHPDLKLRRGYEKNENEALDYFESVEEGADAEKPRFVKELEDLEVRQAYKTVHGEDPEVKIESMKDVDDLLEKYPEERERTGFDEKYKRCEVYFDVKDDHSMTRDELGEKHKVSHTFVSDSWNGKEPDTIRRLRTLEENRLARVWIETNPDIDRETLEKLQSPEKANVSDIGVVRQVSPEKVREFGESFEGGDLTPKQVSSAIERMCAKDIDERHRLAYAELKDGFDSKQISQLRDFIGRERGEIEESLTKKFGLENEGARVAVVEGRMYAWAPKERPDELVKAYEKQFYYFRDRREIASIVKEIRSQLGVEKNPHESLKHINDMLRQFTAGDEGDDSRKRPIREKSTRLEGKVVRFYLDVTDRRLKDLEGRVVKVTGVNGQAGIENPRFPEGRQLEVLKARLAAIIASDCHLRDSGRVTYNEEHLERIARVEEILQSFGDIKLKPVFRRSSYEAHIQNQIGLMMILEGMTPGDKAVNNPGLPRGFLEWSEEARRAYLEELIPEDGGFDSKGQFHWSRSVALYIGKEQNRSGFQSKIGSAENDLIKNHGWHERGLVEQRVISFGKLTDLQYDSDSNTAKTAAKLVSVVKANRSNLVDDEKAVAESLGIEINVRSDLVRYYPAGDKVSVRWKAVTASKDNAIRWAEMCPPNDERKRGQVKAWMNGIN